MGFIVDWAAEIKLVNIKEGDVGGGDGRGKLNRVASVKAPKKKEKGVTAVSRRYNL